MSLFANLRLFALARRGVRALESIARSHADLARVSRERWEVEVDSRLPRRTRVRPAILGELDVAAASARWDAQQAAREAGIDVE